MSRVSVVRIQSFIMVSPIRSVIIRVINKIQDDRENGCQVSWKTVTRDKPRQFCKIADLNWLL